MILYESGDRRYLVGPTFSTGKKSGLISMTTGDFDGDGRLDIAAANNLINNVGVHMNYGTQSLGSLIIYSTGYGSKPSSVSVGDFTHDKYYDIVVANYGTDNGGVFLGDGNGVFTTKNIYSMGDNSRTIAITVADLNHDNQSDIVVINSGTDNICILLGYGNGSFSIPLICSTGLGSGPYGVTTGDYNNDYVLDTIAVTAGTNKVILFQGCVNETFKNEMSHAMGYDFDPYSVAVTDFNGDGWLDIAVGNHGGDYVQILLQTC